MTNLERDAPGARESPFQQPGEDLRDRVSGAVMEEMLVSCRPAPQLASRIEVAWSYDGQASGSHRETVLPNGRLQLMINLASGQGSVCGFQSHHTVIDTASIPPVVGIVFRPGGARGLFDAPADDFLNKIVPLEDVWASYASELRNRLLETGCPERQFQILEISLLGAMKRAGDARLELHFAVAQALEELKRRPHVQSVIDLARESGLSRRRFSQLFSEQVGTTPKLFCRLQRFLEIVKATKDGGEIDWAEVALAGGYFDQAHMAHEFQEFSGLSPGRYLAAAHPHRYHVRTS
jgi:AraC-like DNA-binding protein